MQRRILSVFLLCWTLLSARGFALSPRNGAEVAIKAGEQPSSLCMAVAEAKVEKKTRVLQWKCLGSAEQTWKLQWKGAGRYRLVVKHSGMCLDVTKSSFTEGTELIQYPCHSGRNQTFRLKPVSGDYYQLIADHSGMCLGVGSTNEGEVVVQQRCRNHGSLDYLQLWTFAQPSLPSPGMPPKRPTVTPTPTPTPTPKPKPQPATPAKPAPSTKPNARVVPSGPSPEPTLPSSSGGDISVTPDDGGSPLSW